MTDRDHRVTRATGGDVPRVDSGKSDITVFHPYIGAFGIMADILTIPRDSV